MDDMLKESMIDTLAATTNINKKLFDKCGTAMKELANQARAYVFLLIEKKHTEKKQ